MPSTPEIVRLRLKAARGVRGVLLFVAALMCSASLQPCAAVAEDAMIVETAALGMTGWRTVPFLPATVETAALGMTGWRTDSFLPATVETAALGMTGWRTVPFLPATVETATLGMTGWRTDSEPPERTQVFKVTAAHLLLSLNGQPLPTKLEANCPASIGHRALFTTEGKLPDTIKYHFEWGSGQRSTDYAKLDQGDRKDPLYEPPAAFHEFPYPLSTKDEGGEGAPKGLAGKQGKAKGHGPGAAGRAGSGNEHKGLVRVVVPSRYGAPVASGWAPYHIVCRPKLEVLSGTLELRDPAPPACPRRAEAALTIKTNLAGPVPFSLDCTGDRSWSQTATAHEVEPNTYIAIAVLPVSVEHKEHINCTLKSRLQSPPKVLALRGHAYDCAKTGPDRIVTPPLSRVPPRVAVDPPRPTCVGGKVLVKGIKEARYACHCPAGQTALSTGSNSYRCQGKTVASITCTGGAIRNGQCLCPSTTQKVQAGANIWRCVKHGVTAGPKVRTR